MTNVGIVRKSPKSQQQARPAHQSASLAGSNKSASWWDWSKGAAMLWLASGTSAAVGQRVAKALPAGGALTGAVASPQDAALSTGAAYTGAVAFPGADALPRAGALPAGAEIFAEDSLFAADALLADDGQPRRELLARPRRAAAVASHVRPKLPHPAYEVVVSRHQEDVTWVFKLPSFWNVTVYSTSPSADFPPWPAGTRPQGDYQVIDIEPRPFGHEKVGYAHHLAARYDTLADYTVFSPAYPLEQSPNLVKLMNHPGMLSNVQTMSTRVSKDFPPADVMEHFSQDPWFRSDRFSTRTLEPLYFTDLHINGAARQYAEFFNLTDGSNLMTHYFGKLGLEDWVPEEQEVGSFAYGSIFGVGRSQARRHRREVYEKLQLTLQEHMQTSMLAERAWLMMFGGCDYIDKAPERW